MAYKNFYNSQITESSFDFKKSNFLDYCTNSVSQTYGFPASDFSSITSTNKTLVLGGARGQGYGYTIYKVIFKNYEGWSAVQPRRFYFFETGDGIRGNKYVTDSQVEQFYIKNANGNAIMPEWDEEWNGSEDTGYYAVKILNEYLLISTESDVYDEVIAYSNPVLPTPSSFEPYQPINFTNTPSIDVSKTIYWCSSNGLDNWGTSTTTKTLSWSAYYTSQGQKTATTDGYSMFITITDWAHKDYSIVPTGSTYNIYVGKQVGNDFLNAFKVQLKKWNQYKTDGVISYPQSSLQLSLMSKTVPSIDTEKFTFTYNISSFTITSVTSISSPSNISYHSLASSDSVRWRNVQCKTTYDLEEVVGNSDLSYVGSLTYDDGTTISLRDVAFISQSKTASLGLLPYTVDVDTPETFTITYSMNLQYFGSISKTFDCSVSSDSRVASVVLADYKNNFLPNEVIDYGTNAKLLFKNADNETIKTVLREDFGGYVENVDSKYGTYASNYMVDGNQRLSFTVLGYAVEQLFTVTYYKTRLGLDVSDVETDVIVNPETFTDFDLENLVVTKELHTNAVNADTVVTTSEITTYDVQHEEVDFSQRKQYNISVSYTDNTTSQVLTGSFIIVAEPLRPIRVDCVGNQQEYYDNGEETFVLPSGLRFYVRFNDSNYDEEIFSEDLLFFRNPEKTIALTVGTSIVASTGGNTITVNSLDYGVDGSYTIHWLQDTISAVLFANENAIQAYYGNRLRKIKSQVELTCVRASGKTTTLTGLSNPNDFDFVNNDIILEALNGVSVVIYNQGTFSVSNYDTKLAFNNPTPVVSFNVADFQTAYNNQTDIINPITLGVTLEYYEGANGDKCDYEVPCAYSSTATDAYDKFTVSGNGVLENYGFNSVLDIDMDGETEVLSSIDVTCNDRFGTTATNTLGISIVEILNITGIKLIKAKTNYNVGDTFLSEPEETVVLVYYLDTNNHTKTHRLSLTDGLTSLNVYPIKGTKLNQIARGRTVTISSATDYNVSVQYTINVNAVNSYNQTKIHELVPVYLTDYLCPDGVARSKYFLVERKILVGDEEIEVVENGAIKVGYTVDDVTVLGFLDDVNDTTKNGRVVLFKDYVSPIEGSNNITVKFPCYVDGNSDLINKCRFGIMFGNNNAKNRLFVSGNPNHKNKDWHSSEIDANYTDDDSMITGNYGYFEDLSECVYGETDNAVVGYDIVSNDKLLVLKDKSDKETTVYFRQPQLVTAINSSGTAVTGLNDETLYQEEFSLVKGNNSVAGVSPQSIVNFNGDTLFLSNEKQVCGLDLTGIVGDNQRYANTRSYYIDEDLRHQDLTDAFMWTNNKYLMLVLKSKVYVTYYELKSEETRQYEWFVLDIQGVTSVLERDGTIYLGTDSGEMFMFNEEYKDAHKVFAGYGTTKISINEETEILIATDYLENIDEDKTYLFKPIPLTDIMAGQDPYIYYTLGTINNVYGADSDFYVNNSDNRNVIKLVSIVNGSFSEDRQELLLKRINGNEKVYINKLNSSDNEIACKSDSVFENAYGKEYRLVEYEELGEEHLYQLKDVNGNVMPVKELYRARLCLKVTEPKIMTDINKQDGTFKLLSEGEVIDIVQYNTQSLVSAFRGEIIEYSNVEAFYITKPYTMGSLEYFKTVWSFTLSNDTNMPSEVQLCYASNKIPQEIMKTLAYVNDSISKDSVATEKVLSVAKSALGLDFSILNFEKIDFDKNIAPRTYTHKRTLSNVKFLCFGFRNYNDTNAVLSSLSITYTIPYPSYSGD